MKLWTLTFALVLALPWNAAFATDIDEVRTLLLNGDVDRLDATMSELSKDTEASRIHLYREISDTLFRSSHPTYLATLADWLEQKPSSGTALSANAWAAINNVYLTGSPYGSGFEMPNLHEFQQRWIQSRQRAFELAEQALRTDQRNISAIDAWLFMQRFKPAKGETTHVATRLMSIAPNRQSIRNLVATNVGRAQVRGRAAIDTCHSYANLAQDYNRTLCMIEAAFEHILENDLLDQAGKELAKIDDPRLDTVRFVAENIQGGEKDATALFRLHRSTLARRVEPGEYIGTAQRVAWLTDTPDYVETAHDELSGQLDQWLRDDPLNPRYLLHKSYVLQQRSEYAAARKVWKQALVHGWPDLNLWIIGAMTEFHDENLSEGAKYIEVAAAAAGNKIELLSVHQMFDNAIKKSHSPPQDGVLCLRARIALLSKGLCDVYGQMAGSICRPDHPVFKSVTDTISLVPKNCPRLSETPVSELTFSSTLTKEVAGTLVNIAAE